MFGSQDTFELDLLDNGKRKILQLSAIKGIEGYEAMRAEVLQSDREFKYINPQTAYLRPGGFGGDESEYRKFIDSSFTDLNNKAPKNLLIDLRNNPGGNDSFSDYMVSYIASRPFRWNSSFRFKTSALLKEDTRKKRDTTEGFWQDVLRYKDGQTYGREFPLYQPQAIEKRFEGNVIVLINRQSHSQAAVTAAQIQDYNFGVLVGEETSDFPSLYASVFLSLLCLKPVYLFMFQKGIW